MNGSRRQAGPDATLTTRLASTIPDDDDTLCDLCQRRPKWRDYSWCSVCLRDLTDALNRRRAAELRLPPLRGA